MSMIWQDTVDKSENTMASVPPELNITQGQRINMYRPKPLAIDRCQHMTNNKEDQRWDRHRPEKLWESPIFDRESLHARHTTKQCKEENNIPQTVFVLAGQVASWQTSGWLQVSWMHHWQLLGWPRKPKVHGYLSTHYSTIFIAINSSKFQFPTHLHTCKVMQSLWQQLDTGQFRFKL